MQDGLVGFGVRQVPETGLAFFVLGFARTPADAFSLCCIFTQRHDQVASLIEVNLHPP
jgi:hypothetical protein